MWCTVFLVLAIGLHFAAAASDTYDYVVIGAGTAGSVVAGKLASSSKNFNVLLLEAGPRTDVAGALSKDTLAYFSTPGIWGQSCRFNTDPDCPTDWGFFAKWNGNTFGGMWFGKSTGGSGVQNAMQYHHAPKADFKKWSSLGPAYKAVWRPDKMAAAYRKMESAVPALRKASPNTYGSKGKISVSAPLYNQAGFKDWYIQAWKAAGMPVLDPNGPNQQGGGRLGMGDDKFNIGLDGRRSSTYEEFVVPLLKSGKKNFKLVAGATVTKLVFNGSKRAVAVQYTIGGKSVTVNVKGEVVLSAGAVMSPKILLQSGVGPKADLQQLGVPVVHNLPAVGKNLKDHATFTLHYLFKDGAKTYIDASIDPDQQSHNHELYEKNPPRGPLTAAAIPYTSYMRYPNYMGGKGRVIPLGPNLEITPHATPGGSPPGGCPNPCTGFRVPVLLLQPKSPGGTVQLYSKDPAVKPKITVNFISDERDIKVLYQGLLKAREVAKQQPIASRSYESYPGGAITNYDQFKDKLLHGGFMAKGSHWYGSCALGRVVDHKLSVKGLANVRVADASIMPQISARPQATVMLVGYVAADLILQK